ncbi:MAG TPA: MBL fold metallo-hydrolase [Chitinophagaceae bacterium]|nr:MBL fold metallo-hydrolase [Chitinophagaceae bacterium]
MIEVQIFTFNPMQENTYLLHNEKGDAIIIDPGCYFTAEEEALQTFIEENNLHPVQLINTHCHLDHVFGNKWAAEKYALKLYLHKAEEPLLQIAPAFGISWGFPFDNYKGALHFLEEGDTVQLGDDVLSVLHTPGHSPGSISFYCAAQNFIINGDVLMYESIGRPDLPGGNHQQLLSTIRNKLFTLPAETTVYSGHGPATTIAHEKIYNPYCKE